ncbi:tRNA dihydrouridine(20/20a) synthase DusA [uncultured Algimonas sp.]|uniref:tRNA dihydrouridine(20/20a) synthase DusA n=1 Tax=uncultured Algimonas sp. TaxID=1547920 RepID=UPI00262CDA7D|nr:tRNA dihydrouridine(20/20a) synthase DusA [uncultured Algimonas sp.]
MSDSDLKPDFAVSVAPMMDWTDRHCRLFHRHLSRRVRLYTEMVVADAVIYGPRDRLLSFDALEHPVALQLGGSDPDKLREATGIGAAYGYDEINLNVGCPSDRVQSGRFGACLMAEPSLVADCFKAMRDSAGDAAVTIKCRLGIDDQDVERTLPHFIETVSGAGCRTVIVHARKAWLQGLSPKQNRTVPPIDYALVTRMKEAFPDLGIIVNGQIETVSQGLDVAQDLDGFMMGRAAYNDPWSLTAVDPAYGDPPAATDRAAVARDMVAYLERVQDTDRTAKALIRHMMGLFAGQPGARLWRRTLSEGLTAKLAPSDILASGLGVMTTGQAA